MIRDGIVGRQKGVIDIKNECALFEDRGPEAAHRIEQAAYFREGKKSLRSFRGRAAFGRRFDHAGHCNGRSRVKTVLKNKSPRTVRRRGFCFLNAYYLM